MQILSEERIALARAHYAAAPAPAPLFGYTTTRDFCDSADVLPELSSAQGDLKDAQRPWAVKTILSHVPAGAYLVELGAGEPLVAQTLVDLGYRVTIVDPYDGSGHGPTAFDEYVRTYPAVTFVRSNFGPGVLDVGGGKADAVYSISVLEHVGDEGLAAVFAGIDEVLAAGGASLHCYDYIVEGNGSAYNQSLADALAAAQCLIQGYGELRGGAAYQRVIEGMRTDLDTYYLSAAGHNRWRGAIPYDQFPYRRVASFTTFATRRA